MRAFFILVALAMGSFFTVAQSPETVPGEVIVMLKPKVSPSEYLSQLNANFPQLRAGHQKVLSQRINVHLCSFDKTFLDAEEAAGYFSELSEALIAQPNHTGIQQRDSVPDDPYYFQQWMYPIIQAGKAWSLSTGGVTKGGDTIVVAVIDGGADLSHPDVNYFKNKLDTPNNSIDDDSNGYVDDFDGWNAYQSNGDVPDDYHGTHVSGIIGARGNNNLGVTGVNWNVKIMPVAGSDSKESTVVEAYGYVLEMRARYNETNGEEGAYVVATNSSFGINLADPSNYPLWCAFYDSLGAYGVLSAGATANISVDVDSVLDIPTACQSDYLISVTNTDQYDYINAGAAYGLTTIDIGAPGTSVYSTSNGGGYSHATGTSMATPVIAGTVALMYSYICDSVLNGYSNKPDSLALKVRELLLQKGYDPITDLSGRTVTGGRVNLEKALDAVEGFCKTEQPNNPGPTGLETPEAKEMLKLYPNPSDGLITVLAPSPMRVQLFNMHGQEVVAMRVLEQEMTNIALESGIYLFVGTSEEGRTVQKKVVVK